MGVVTVVREVKKPCAGRALWNVRTGAGLSADLEATAMVEGSLKGLRSTKDILRSADVNLG